MPPINDYYNTRNKPERAQRRWWNAPQDTPDVSRQLFTWIRNIELVNWPRRYANLIFYRYMTGRPTNPAFNYAVGARPGSITSYYSRAQWQAPSFNALAMVDDVLANRIYTQRPFLQWCPDAGDFSQRVKAKKLTRWTDAAFHDLKLWPLVSQMGADCRMYGTGYMLVDAGISKEIEARVVMDDEVIIDEAESNLRDNPKTIAVRTFETVDDLIDRFGEVEGAEAAIRNAPKVELGMYFGSDIDTSDLRVLALAWHLPTKTKPGRRVLAVDGFVFSDEPYKRDHFPLARMRYKKLSGSWRGQGVAEQIVSLQRDIERQMSADWENMRRMAWPRVLKPTGAQIPDGAFADKSGGIIPYAGDREPKFVFPEALSPETFRYLAGRIQMVKDRVGISDSAARTPREPGLSGVAIAKEAQLDDARHTELLLEVQDAVEQIGILLVEAGVECKPTVTLPGRKRQEIKWSDIGIDKSSFGRPKAFPMSSLSQDMAHRQQQIDTWFAEGSISKKTKMRLEQVPDTDGYLDLVNAAEENVFQSIEFMIEENEFVPAEPFGDLDAALEIAQSLYVQEKNESTPQDRLDHVLRYIAQLQEMIEERDASRPAAAPAPAGFGVQPPAGPAPAPPAFPLPAAGAPAPPA